MTIHGVDRAGTWSGEALAFSERVAHVGGIRRLPVMMNHHNRTVVSFAMDELRLHVFTWGMGKYMRNLLGSIALLLVVGVAPAASAQEQAVPGTPVAAATGTGTLVVDIKAFTSEKELPKKVEKQLKNGGLEWGVRDGLIVFTMVGKQFVDFPITHMTRYGQSESLTLPAGEYRITGIGLEMTAGFSVQKILDRGAFVNEDVIAFRIESGKTTTLSINPVIKRDNAFVVDYWMPTLMASVASEPGPVEEKALNVRGERSIAWPNYGGPLKFVAK